MAFPFVPVNQRFLLRVDEIATARLRRRPGQAKDLLRGWSEAKKCSLRSS